MEERKRTEKRVMMTHENTLTTHMGDINEGEKYKSARELILIVISHKST